MTTPAVAALRRALPLAHLTYVVEEPFRRLVEGSPDIDEVLLIPPRQSVLSFLGFIRRLRREKYDIVLDFHGGPRASRIAWLARATLKVGYALKGKGLFYDIRVPRSRNGGRVHSVENHLNLVRATGIELGEPLPRLILPSAGEGERRRIDKLWEEHGLIGTKVVVLHVGAGNEFRDWGAENWGELAKLLTGVPGVRVILVGSGQDAPRAAEIRKENAEAVVSLAGALNLIELRETIGRAVLFVGPDSGPMHIAATTTTPIVAPFGPTLPANFSPWRARATLIEKPLDCRPCRQRHCPSEDFRCLRTITVDEVLEACRPYLAA